VSGLIYLYGAYDRYNFGDNLMPIVIKMFISKFHPELCDRLRFISLSESDLTRYDCKRTLSIDKILPGMSENDVIIVVGGEVLGSSIGTLYTHVQKSKLFTTILRKMNKYLPFVVNSIAKKHFSLEWQFPYTPRLSLKNKSSFCGKVIYNTVGGNCPISSCNDLSAASYISVRDERTFSGLRDKGIQAELIPDSVLLISRLLHRDKIVDFIKSDAIRWLEKEKYIVVQVCPYKAPCSPKVLSDVLRDFKRVHPDVSIILLPIGYASGHDDYLYMKEVNKIMPDDTVLLFELTIYEIIYVLAHSMCFFGTSLHGVIVSMSYGVPYFSINERIVKISSFIKTWSIPTLDKPIMYNDIPSSFKDASMINRKLLEINASEKIDMIEDSFRKYIGML